MPTHVIFLSLIYPAVGLLLGRASVQYDLVPLLYPLATGFALLGPIAAIGLYELSRRREMGLDTSWKHAFDVFRSPSLPAIAALGLLLVVLFCVWIAVAHGIFTATLGDEPPATPAQFAQAVLHTPAGHRLIVLGNLAGLLFAVAAFAVSVVSIPLLLDRKVGFAAAVVTSIKVILANPVTMALWGLIIAGGLVLGSLPLLCGLAIVMPVLGHASWHLYRRVIVPEIGPRPCYDAPDKDGRRYAAEFPASLFARSRHRGPE